MGKSIHSINHINVLPIETLTETTDQIDIEDFDGLALYIIYF